MARVATSGWVSGRVAPSRMRLYHVLFMVFAALASVAIATPSVLAQRTLYQASATVRFDPAHFPGVAENGTPGRTLNAMQQQLGEVLKESYPTLGSRWSGLQFRVSGPGVVEVVGFAPFAAESVALTNDAAQGLARRIYTVEGMPLLRDLLGRQLQASLEGHPAQSPEEELMRKLILTDAIDGGVAPAPGRRSFADLEPAERSAVTRALEIQYELTELDRRRAERANETERRARAATRLQALRDMEHYLYDTYGTDLRDPTLPAPAFVAALTTNANALPTYGLLTLAAAAAAGLFGGFLTVLIDRQVGILLKLQELWGYRELIRNMVLRDLKARYKNSLLGYFWSLLNPLMTMLIFWLVFSVMLKNRIPMFPVFLIVALLPWNFAVTAVSGGMRSILDNANLVKKVYFPREILPLTVVLANLVNYVLALPVMLLVMAGVQLVELGHLQFSWYFAFVPVILAIQVIFLIGVTLLLSTVAVFFRDTTHIIDILIQLWIFLTPVFYSLEAVTQGNLVAAKAVRWLNPMASLVDFYRDVLYGQATNPVPGLPALDGVFRTLLTALVILAIGAYVFHRNSGRFGEEL
ncbi:MAG: ABC transporter permease [Chloroflexota bacterium]|nr:ABC transporter permease [Chloroflexota bacterium]